jgi:hypothetical protein
VESSSSEEEEVAKKVDSDNEVIRDADSSEDESD